jgi:uncharacterized phiE125 gp8 family phage protein
MIVYSRVTERPAYEPISVSEAKVHLEYYGTSKDAYIEGLIKVARRLCEAYSGLSFVTQERVIRMDKFPSVTRTYKTQFIELPYGPVQSITLFQYANEDGTTTSLVEGTDYVVDYHSSPARVYPLKDGEIDEWPTDVRRIPHAVNIGYMAGYDDISGEPIPAEAKQAIMLQVASMFESRQDEHLGLVSHKINMNSEYILDAIKVYWNANID